MDIAGWVLVGFAALIAVVLVPQIVRTRTVLSEARSEDRFSAGQHLLRIAEPVRDRGLGSQPLHASQAGGTMDRPVASSVRLAYDVRQYHALRARRSAQISERAAASTRRLALTVAAGAVMVMMGLLAGLSVLPWGWLALPLAAVAAVLAWGVVAARQGARVDGEILAEIALLESRLRQSAAGRRVLRGADRSSFTDWADSISEAGGVGAGLEGEVSAGAVAPQPREAIITEQTEQSTSVAEALPGDARQSKPSQPAVEEGTLSEVGTDPRGVGERLWTPVPVPVPTYTLRAGAPAMVAREPLSVPEFAQVPVTMRPTRASFPPAGVVISEPVVTGPIDLEEILNRRRAAV